MDQQTDQPLEGRVVAQHTQPSQHTQPGAPVGFTSSTTGSVPAAQDPRLAWAQNPTAQNPTAQNPWAGYPASTPPPTLTPTRARKRWVPFALAGAGVVLLLGGGGAGYALGVASVDTTGTAQTGQVVPGTDGSTGPFGTPPDAGGGFGQSGQQGGTSDGTTGTTDGTQGTTTADTTTALTT